MRVYRGDIMEKLLVVDLEDPKSSHYRKPETMGSWFLGRSIDRYQLFIVDDEKERHNSMFYIYLDSANANYIQMTVDAVFGIKR
jgi:hypothetical protein